LYAENKDIKALKVDVICADMRFVDFRHAREWAKKNIARIYNNEETGGKGSIEISNTAIDKYFNESSVLKSENAEVHKSVVSVLPNVIRSSIVGEVHADYIKQNSLRSKENGAVPNTKIHRLYGAILFDGEIYRVKTTIKYFTNNSSKNKAHSYEVIKIKLLDEEPNSPERNQDSQTVSPIPVAKLREGIEKSYEKGKYLLDDVQSQIFV